MTELHYPALYGTAIFGLLLAIPVLSQSRPTVPGDTLISVRGLTDPNAMNESWQTPLMAAANDADEKSVKDLIERKANVNVGDMSGMTALMYARGLPTVKLLLSAGASVNDKDITGKPALYYATQRADPDIVDALINAGANVNAKDDKGMSPLQLATKKLPAGQDLRDAYRERVQRVIDLLIASGARLDLSVAAASEGPSKVKQHPLKQMAISTWRKFLNEDTLYIITDQERTAAKELTTDQQRDDFITAFWERRNPNPGSPENAFEEEHYRRIAYANEHFGTKVREGWKTDRGRIYIIYGPPNYVDSPRRLLATEIWHYASVQGLGQNVVLTFTDRDKDGRFPLTDEDVDSHPRIRGGQTVYYY